MDAAVANTTTDGWHAQLQLGFARRGPRTVLSRRSHHGPLAVQRPFYPEDDACHIYLLHPPGGVVGGDQLQIELSVAPNAVALVTTPGATKFYRSAGSIAHQSQTLHVDVNASLEWLPQDNILFPGANVSLDTRVDLASGARFFGWEMHCLGRPSIGERFTDGHADLGLRIYRDGRPLLLERLRIEDGAGLDGSARLRGHPVSGTLCATGCDKDLLSQLRDHLGAGDYGATLVDDLLLLRYLGPSTDTARKLFTAAWTLLREAVIGRAPCPPRIWAT